MKPYHLFFLFLPLVSSACLSNECRDCEPFNFNAGAINPDFDAENLVFENVSTGDEVTFERIQFVATPAQEVCSSDVDSPDEIDCNSSATISYRNQDLGIDMLFGVERQQVAQAGRVNQALFSYEFKSMEATRFIRTHALIVEPQIQLATGAVERLDTLTLGSQSFEDVLILIQPVEAFEALGSALPASGRFTNIYLQEGTGLIGLRDINDQVYIRR